MLQFFLTDQAIYLVVFNIATEEGANEMDFWLNSVTTRARGCPIIVVGTHADEEQCTKVYIKQTFEKLRTKFNQEKFPTIKDWIAVTTTQKGKGMKGIRELRMKMAECTNSSATTGVKRLSFNSVCLMKYVEYKKQRLKTDRVRVPMFSWKDISDFAQTSLGMTEEETRQTLQLLHKIGEIICCDAKYGSSPSPLSNSTNATHVVNLGGDSNATFLEPGPKIERSRSYTPGTTRSSSSNISSITLENTLFIDPQWLSDVFGCIVLLDSDVKETLIKDGCLSSRNLGLIWTQYGFPLYTHPLLLDLLQRYDIIYRIPSQKKEKESEENFVIPSLLPKERPPILKDIWPAFEDNESELQLNRTFEFNVMPMGFFARLVVRYAFSCKSISTLKYSLTYHDYINRTTHLVAQGLAKVVACWNNGMLLLSCKCNHSSCCV